ncbi:hypothetical protein HDU76_005771 [Blyttiomyces sp. JEL0837]|nr:hypothetical protein HDU76_005771 [Blyttiomyces sp. JEL0837]
MPSSTTAPTSPPFSTTTTTTTTSSHRRPSASPTPSSLHIPNNNINHRRKDSTGSDASENNNTQQQQQQTFTIPPYAKESIQTPRLILHPVILGKSSILSPLQPVMESWLKEFVKAYPGACSSIRLPFLQNISSTTTTISSPTSTTSTPSASTESLTTPTTATTPVTTTTGGRQSPLRQRRRSSSRSPVHPYSCLWVIELRPASPRPSRSHSLASPEDSMRNLSLESEKTVVEPVYIGLIELRFPPDWTQQQQHLQHQPQQQGFSSLGRGRAGFHVDSSATLTVTEEEESHSGLIVGSDSVSLKSGSIGDDVELTTGEGVDGDCFDGDDHDQQEEGEEEEELPDLAETLPPLPQFDAPHLATFLDPVHCGNGYSTEAVKAALVNVFKSAPSFSSGSTTQSQLTAHLSRSPFGSQVSLLNPQQPAPPPPPIKVHASVNASSPTRVEAERVLERLGFTSTAQVSSPSLGRGGKWREVWTCWEVSRDGFLELWV